MDSRPFDKLPNEVVLHVFVKGAEDEPEMEDYDESCFRRLKSFAALARQVCARWKTIIDKTPSSISFWIAHLVLRPGWLNERKEIAFATQLATFRRQLLSSNGCDLFIYLNLYALSEKAANRYASVIIRLVMHAMDMFLLYHSQVAGLVFLHCPSEISIPLLKLIATHWTNAPRLALVDVGVDKWKGADGMRRMIMDMSNLHVYEWILPQTSIQASSQLSLTHLRNLDALEIPARLCIDEGLVLPPNLQHLTLVTPRDGLPKLYDLLLTQNVALKGLRSMGIERETEAEVIPIDRSDNPEPRKPPIRQSLGQIDMPLLRRISLRWIPMQVVWDFLGLLPCKSLEDLYLALEGEEELDKHYFCNFPSDFPRLTHVDLRITVTSWQSLHYLEVFTSLPIHVLDVWFYKYQPEWIDHLNVFYIALSKLGHLQKLKLLHLRFGSVNTDESLAPIAQQLVFPRLTEFSFHGAEDECIYFLSQFQAPQLDTVVVSSVGNFKEPEGGNQQKALQVLATKSIASVRVADLQFSQVDQPLWSLGLFPNLHELRIRIWKDTEDDAFLFLISDVIQPLCDAIATGPFPHLHSIHAQCVAKNMQTIEWSDGAKEEVHRIVQDMLVRLAKAGGLTLQTKPLQFDGDASDPYSREAAVTFEAWAAPSDPLVVP